MARISTYPEDTTIHPDDHVIGTNAGSAGGTHGNETVIFPVSALASFITQGFPNMHFQTMSYGTADDPRGEIIPEDDSSADAYYGSIDTTTGETLVAAQYPLIDVEHNLDTEQVHVAVFRLNEDGARYDWYDYDSFTIVDANNVIVNLGAIERYEGYITVTG